MARVVMELTTRVAGSLADVFRFFSDPQNLARLTPEAMRFKIRMAPLRPLRRGDRIEYSIRIFGLPVRWTTLITAWRENELFEDLQESGPYRYWLHTHSFRESGVETEMRDRVEYELPFGIFGRLFGGALVGRQLRRIFAYRAEAIGRVFTTNG
jgi:ligand-binding SRPBCC domain-containing protein